jgi:hypothetical protein
MTPVERAELADLRREVNEGFEALRQEMARGFRDSAERDRETRSKVDEMRGAVGVVKWLGPAGVVALIVGCLFQVGAFDVLVH